MFRSSLERGERPQVYEDGGQMRDFVHVDDVARANLRALEAVVDDDPGRYAAYNVASGHPVTILDVARLVAAGTASGSSPRSPAATGSATSGTSWPPRPGRAPSSASPRRCCPPPAWRRSPRHRCATEPHQSV